MSSLVIKATNLSKCYRIAHRQAKDDGLRHVVENALRAPLSLFKNSTQRSEDFWALRDVSFEVRSGEVLGIIGRNGAGKSTLLKILSRITELTSGRIELRGRVASLLEVGTGFHPELTGRENIFLNGAILGMSRQEIKSKFDEIVSFAEVEKFLDTPVKRYSSGMFVRLAFAVAAHLEPEILIIDEVLAVGDAQFQKKCLGRMQEVSSNEGRTVLFVSHNMSQVARVCQRCILLEQGRVALDGDVSQVTSAYLMANSGLRCERKWDGEARPGDDVARLTAVRVISRAQVSDTVQTDEPVTLEMDFQNFRENALLMAAFTFINSHGTVLFVSADLYDPRWGNQPRPRGNYRASCTVPGGIFNEGLISVVAEISTRSPLYHHHVLEFEAVTFQVVDAEAPGSLRTLWARDVPGAVRPMETWQRWQTTRLDSSDSSGNAGEARLQQKLQETAV